MMNLAVVGGHAALGFWLWKRDNDRRFLLRDETDQNNKLISPPQANIHLDTIATLSTCRPNLNSTPILPDPLDSTPCSFIDDPLELSAMAARLATSTRLALDIEHHSTHTYYGRSCLIQLSDGCEDFVIDAVKLRAVIPSTLGPLFSDPKILKVVHGGGSDVTWLLRDFGIRLINILDTEKCCQVLSYHQQSRSLKYLMRKFVCLEVDKTLQMADWRQRPLSKELMDYARGDVHFLLYIADCLGKELLAHDHVGGGDNGGDKEMKLDPESLLGRAVHRSQSLSLVEYSPPLPRIASSASAAGIMKNYISVLRTNPNHDATTDTITIATVSSPLLAPFDESRILQINEISVRVHALCVWRDAQARKIDEGVTCVLPDAVLLSVAKQHYYDKNLLNSVEDVCKLFLEKSKSIENLCKFPEIALDDASTILKELNASGAGKRPWSHPDVLNAMKPPATTLETAAKRRHEDPETFKERLGERFGVKKEVYENCRMLSKSGEMLCFTDRKRLLWYIRKGLAVKVKEDPLTVQLTFEHREDDQRVGAHEFYSSKRSNTCVSCGSGKHYLRYRVVPVCYRRALPERFKSHRSHDVVLLCVECHEIAQRASEQMKRDISKEYEVPLFPRLAIPPTPPPPVNGTSAASDTPAASSNAGDDEKNEKDETTITENGMNGHHKTTDTLNPESLHPFSVRKAAVALDRIDSTKAALPDWRREELQTLVATYARTVEPWLQDIPINAPFSQNDLWAGLLAGMSKPTRRRAIRRWISQGHEEQLPLALLQELQLSGTEGCNSGIDLRDGMGHSWHGQQVVQVALERGGDDVLSALCSRFRQAFIDALNPKYLPPGWKVDHTAPRSFGEHSIFNEDEVELLDDGDEEDDEDLFVENK